MKTLKYKIRPHYSHCGAFPHNVEAFYVTNSNMYDQQDWPDWLHEACDKDLDDDDAAICYHKGIFYLINSGISGDVVRITEDHYIVRSECGGLGLFSSDRFAGIYKVVEQMRYTTRCIERNGSECVECFKATPTSMRNLGDWPDWMHEACNRNLDEEGVLCNHNGTYWIHQPGLDGKMVKVSGEKYIVYHEEKDYICLWDANDFEEQYHSINAQGGWL